MIFDLVFAFVIGAVVGFCFGLFVEKSSVEDGCIAVDKAEKILERAKWRAERPK